MITPLLQTALEPVIDRHRTLRRLRWLVLGLAVLTIAVAVAAKRHVAIPDRKLLAILLILGIYGAARIAGRLWRPNFQTVARRIEQQHPELHALLITAVEQKPDPQTGKFNFLQQRVVRQVAEEGRKSNWLDAVPGWRLWSLRLMACIFAVATLALSFRTTRPAATALAESVPAEAAVTVNPGDTTVERGSGLVVLADFHRHPPGEATLVVQPKNQPAQRIPLVKNLDDPVFGGGLPEVDADLTYHVEYAGQSTRDFSVKVFEHPRLERADATLRYPGYTKLPEKKVPDTHRVSGVEGTKLDVSFQLNKSVKSATLVAKDGSTLPLAVQADKAVAELRDFPLKASQTYELKLEDAEGRANKLPTQFIVEALPNRRPELKFITPKGDPRVSPIEEVAFQAQLWDDFGLSHYGLTINVAGRGEKQIELGHDTHADEKKDAAYLLKLEELGVKPDELISWFLWADDVGPDGKVRHTATDMYFAEVRPFEEIFRRDNSGGDGSGGQGEGESTKLAEMQKQIVSATWNLKRAEDGLEKPSDKYLKDEPVVRDSQEEALKKAKQLVAKAEDPKQHALAENAAHEMQTALDHLTKAATSNAPLSDALAAEQTAYDALLKLAAHEFRVQKNKQGKGTAQQRQQQQLDQLEMKDEKERYETNREAKPQENEQQREQLAILNRLKELAQRQQDINERLKELQTALQDAKTEQQKDEIRRQLKRLQEEEKQMLADIDETRQKMGKSTQQAQLADEKQQLDKTRDEAQQTSEAMEKGAPSQALASGTRAQRDLQQLRDEFRKKTSGQFSEEMRQMRNDARELAKNQEDLAEKLAPQPAKPERPTLDGSGEREQLADKFTKQQGDLSKLTEKMKDVSEKAEGAEPLLARELYDTLRKSTQAGTDQTLEKTQQLAQRGYADDARRFEQKARKEIEDLKTGVEHAAESVLGNEADALRAARAEVDALKKDLEREIATARPDLAQTSPAEKAGEKSGIGAKGQPQQDGKPQPRKDGKEASEQSPEGGQKGSGDQKGGGQKKGDGEQKSDSPAGNQTADGKGEGEGKPGQNGKAGGEQAGAKPQQDGSSPGESPGGDNATVQQGGKGGNNGSAAQHNGNNGGQRDAGRLRQLASHAGENSGSGGDGGNGGGGAATAFEGPLTGDRFVEWSDRLRNVEEMVDDPNLRAEIARIRETAKGVRVDFKRNGAEPKWDMVKSKIGSPLAELHNRLTEELARRESKESLVPLDRDPVPPKYAERVRRYYEELGRSR
ncbi:MAG: hypothetical protein ABJF10_15795 [Chthoniobacter sp.]|uniref:hypothetical protein n=1 Tax=Chthoniobacter sp. TaxID=2510640 RepID=UPI0032A83EEB